MSDGGTLGGHRDHRSRAQRPHRAVRQAASSLRSATASSGSSSTGSTPSSPARRSRPAVVARPLPAEASATVYAAVTDNGVIWRSPHWPALRSAWRSGGAADVSADPPRRGRPPVPVRRRPRRAATPPRWPCGHARRLFAEHVEQQPRSAVDHGRVAVEFRLPHARIHATARRAPTASTPTAASTAPSRLSAASRGLLAGLLDADVGADDAAQRGLAVATGGRAGHPKLVPAPATREVRALRRRGRRHRESQLGQPVGGRHVCDSACPQSAQVSRSGSMACARCSWLSATIRSTSRSAIASIIRTCSLLTFAISSSGAYSGR